MTGWLEKKASARSLSSETMSLAKAIALLDGRALMPKPQFRKWRAAHRKLKGPARVRRAEELLALALRFQRVGQKGQEAVAQLLVLTGDLL
jgi:hypothetical protein